MSNGNRWVGIDLHRRRSQIAIIDDHGELTVSRRIVNDRDTFRELLGDPEATHVALEATYGWEWLAELLRLRRAPRAPAAHAGDRRRAREDRRRRRQDARAPAAHRAVARGVHRPARAARPARATAPPRRADQDAHRGQEPRARAVGPPGHPARAHRPVRQRRTRVPRRRRAARRIPPAAGQPDVADR